MTAGTRPARRVRRAPPLPNSVRGSALILTSDTIHLLLNGSLSGRANEGARGNHDPEHRVDHGAINRLFDPQGTLAVATRLLYPITFGDPRRGGPCHPSSARITPTHPRGSA